jgi:hypothetical protein
MAPEHGNQTRSCRRHHPYRLETCYQNTCQHHSYSRRNSMVFRDSYSYALDTIDTAVGVDNIKGTIRLFDYLSVVGSLLHIENCTRCDVPFSDGVISRHALCPGQAHVNAAERVVMFLYNTQITGLQYSRSTTIARNVPSIYQGSLLRESLKISTPRRLRLRLIEGVCRF